MEDIDANSVNVKKTHTREVSRATKDARSSSGTLPLKKEIPLTFSLAIFALSV